MTDARMLVFSNAVAGQDDAFNEWYDTRHLADVTSVPGVVRGERFEVVETRMPGQPSEPPPHRYLAVYELDADPDAVVREFGARAASGAIALSPALDVSTLAVSVWRARDESRAAVD